jgi:hypothetical protein
MGFVFFSLPYFLGCITNTFFEKKMMTNHWIQRGFKPWPIGMTMIWPWYDQQLSKKLLDLQQSHQIKKYNSFQKSRIPILNGKVPLFDWLTWVNKPKRKPVLEQAAAFQPYSGCRLPPRCTLALWHTSCEMPLVNESVSTLQKVGVISVECKSPKNTSVSRMNRRTAGWVYNSVRPKKTPSIPWSLLGHYKYPPGLLSTWLQYIPTYPNNIPTIVDVCITNTI